VLVLAMLTIAALLSAGMASRSFERAAAAALMQEELQLRWGELSCRAAVLNRAEILLRIQEQKRGEILPAMETAFELGGHTYFLILSDEQAKLNLNTVFREKDLSQVRQAASLLSAEFPVHLRPDPRASRRSAFPPAFSGLGQVYDFRAAGNEWNRGAERFLRCGQEVSCWGNGMLNINRASPERIRMAGELAAPPQTVSRLLETVQENRGKPLDVILKETDISDRERREFRKLFTDRSRTFSLGMIVSTPNRSRVRLDVRSLDNPFGSGIESFYW